MMGSRWTPGELAAFLAAVRDTRLQAGWHLVAFAVLRVGELLALTWSDVDLDHARIALVICDEGGRPQHPRQLARAFAEAITDAGMRPVGLPTIRHAVNVCFPREGAPA